MRRTSLLSILAFALILLVALPSPAQVPERGAPSRVEGSTARLTIAVTDGADLLVTDSSGRRTGLDPATGSTVIEIPDSTYPQSATGVAGRIVRAVDILRPADGAYHVTVAGLELGTYVLTVTASRGSNGGTRLAFSGIAGPGSAAAFQVRFSASGSRMLTVSPGPSFQSVQADIDHGLQSGLIDDPAVAGLLSGKLGAARAAAGRGDAQAASNDLKAFLNLVGAQSGKHISVAASRILEQDAAGLLQPLLNRPPAIAVPGREDASHVPPTMDR